MSLAVGRYLLFPIQDCLAEAEPGPMTSTCPATGGSIVYPIPEGFQKLMVGVTYHPDCPVGLDSLALLDRIRYFGFDGVYHDDGRLVAHVDRVNDLQEIFHELARARFPIRRIRPILHYQGNDEASMTDDNTSAFNCRPIAGTKRWSRHAYGCAVDINPLENPCWTPSTDTVEPSVAREFVEREPVRQGMIVDGDVVTQLFLERGWIWGGLWKTLQDWQHFEKPLDD